MKKTLIILFLFSTSFSSESYLSFYGSGERLSNLNPSSISLGWSNLFDANNYLNTANLSNVYLSDLVRLSMGADFNFNFIGDNKYYSNKMTYFNFLLPVQKNKKALGFSLSPLYRINSTVIESEYNYYTDSDATLAYKSKYNFEGGPSVFSVIFSSELTKNISLGIKADYIFGSLYSYKEHSIYNIQENFNVDDGITTDHILGSTDLYTTISNYNGYGLELEGSFHNLKNRLSVSINLMNQIQIDEYFYDDIVPEALELGYDYNQKIEYNLPSPMEINIGFSRKLNDKNTLIAEYYMYKPYEGDKGFNILNNPDVDKNRFSIGYYRPLMNNNLVLSTGLYQIDSNSDEMESNKQGITLGLGVNIKSISADFCLEIGRNKVTIDEVFDEKYVNLYMGLTSSDKWFK